MKILSQKEKKASTSPVRLLKNQNFTLATCHSKGFEELAIRST